MKPANAKNIPLSGRLDRDIPAIIGELFERSCQLPLPADGSTLERWRVFAAIAQTDLSITKLFEAHADALAIMAELNQPPPAESSRWGVWTAESGKMRLQMHRINQRNVRLYGRKSWCSGAPFLTHALVTAWEKERGPFLIAVALNQPHVRVFNDKWKAIGMNGTATSEVHFDAAAGQLIGDENSYLSRPGFWHGAAGIAACWYGATQVLAEKLRTHLRNHPSMCNAHTLAHVGAIDIALQQSAALMHETARWLDSNRRQLSRVPALRLRGSIEATANNVLERVGKSLGAAPFCEDAHFAQLAADLPVYLRQSHAELDLAQLGDEIINCLEDATPWQL